MASMLLDYGRYDEPQLIDRCSVRRIAGDQSGRSLCQNERVQRSSHPEGQGICDRIARPRTHQFCVDPASCNVIRQDGQQPRSEWRAQTFTPPNLFGERIENGLPISIIFRTGHPRLRFMAVTS